MSKVRYLITGADVSGGDALARILHSAGAVFGTFSLKNSFVHPRLSKAFRYYKLSGRIADSILPAFMGRYLFERKMRNELDTVFSECSFTWSPHLVWMVRDVESLGYSPGIIAVCGRFGDWCEEKYIISGMSVCEMADEYVEIYRTVMMQLGIYGGCVVSTDDIFSEKEKEWCSILGKATGLDESAILDARKQIKPLSRPERTIIENHDTEKIYEGLMALKNRVIEGAVNSTKGSK